MSKRTPGPWHALQVGGTAGPWLVQRFTARTYEYLRTDKGWPARFMTKPEADAAIAKFTGKAS